MDPREPAADSTTDAKGVTGGSKPKSGPKRGAQKSEQTFFLTGRSKRVDFTREPAEGANGKETAAVSSGGGDAPSDDAMSHDEAERWLHDAWRKWMARK